MNKENQILNNDVESFDVDFSKLNAKDFEEALAVSLDGASEEFEQVRKMKNHTFEELFGLPKVNQLLSVYGLLRNLVNLIENKEYREIYEKYGEILTGKFIEWNFDKKSFKNLEAYSRSSDYAKQPLIRQNIVQKNILDLKKSGIDLSNAEQKKFRKVSQRLSVLTNKFANNVTDAQKNLNFIVSKNSLRGLSDRAWANVEALRVQKGLPEEKCYIDEVSGLLTEVMSDVRNQSIRKKIYQARKKTCLSGKFNNTKLADTIYKLKQEKASILGYPSLAHQVLEDNMASTPENVLKFINELGNEALPHARAQFKEMTEFGEKLLKRPVEPWDIQYVTKKMKSKQLSLDANVVREYFPVEHVIKSLFDFCEEKFGVSFVQTTKSTWHEDVKVLNVVENGEVIGNLYMDLYKRDGKRPGAWLSPICTARDNTISKKKAVALLVCNAPKDVGESTFSIDEVVTLFHEMGHALHHLLSKVKEEFYSGFNHVQHDAIEFPSQLLDMFVFNEDVLKRISKNVRTGAPLSKSLITKIQKSKKFLGALQIMRTLQYSDMDMTLYLQHDKTPFEVENEIKEKWLVNPNYDKNLFLMKNFLHIFGGGYSAGYYGYQWAEVLSADAYRYLTEKVSKKENQARFDSYKRHVLYTGGEQTMSNNYYDFTKSEPNVKSLIEQYI